MNKKAILKTADWVRNGPLEEKCGGAHARGAKGEHMYDPTKPEAVQFCALGYLGREVGHRVTVANSGILASGIWINFDTAMSYARRWQRTGDPRDQDRMCSYFMDSAAALERLAESTSADGKEEGANE